MTIEISEAKRALRQEVLARLQTLTATEREAASAQARARLAARPEWGQARSILFYAPLPGELDLWPLAAEALAGGKTVALPRFVPARRRYIACQVRDLARDVQPGHFGIREPAGPCPPILLKGLDLLLVPGVAFDLHGGRLGRGKGYYDQLLAGVRGVKCGVAFERQLVAAVPVARNDIRMNCILTPTRWIGW